MGLNRLEAALRHTDISREEAGDKLAGLVSKIGSPPVMLFASIGLLVALASGNSTWHWALVYLAVAAFLPLLYFTRLYRSGRVTDMDISHVEERRRPMLVTLACMAAAGAILWVGGAPHLLAAWSWAIWAQLALVTTITFRWKISVHSSAAAGMTALLVALLGPEALLAVPFIGLVGWSRIRLAHHTPAQTVAGALLGALVTTGLLHLLLKA